MTVAGFRKCDGFALAWQDSETYLNGAAAGAMTKLAVSSTLVGMACGFADLVGRYRDRVKAFGATSFERAVSVLPHELRAARATKIEHARDHDYVYDPKSVYALIGCSAGRIRGAVFYERRDFEAIEADEWLSPYIDAEPETAAGVLATAQRQLQYVRRECPDATGRMLDVARVSPDGVVSTRVPLLLASERRSLSLGDTPAHERARLVAIEARRRWSFA